MLVRRTFGSGLEIYFDDHQLFAVGPHLAGYFTRFENIRMNQVFPEKKIVHIPTSFMLPTIVLTISPKFETIQKIFMKGAKQCL